MAQKSPYEVRLEVLQMAKDYMDSIQQLNEQAAKHAMELALKANIDSLGIWNSFVPKAYTVEELTAKANEMYNFVVAGTGAKNV